MAHLHDKQVHIGKTDIPSRWVSDFYYVQTSDGTATDIAAIPIQEDQVISVHCQVAAAIADYSAGLGDQVSQTFRRESGQSVTAIGTETDITSEDSSGSPSVSINAAGGTQTIDVRVTGVAAETWNWVIRVSYLVLNG